MGDRRTGAGRGVPGLDPVGHRRGRALTPTVGRRAADRGSAVVDFVLVGALVTLLALGVVQLTLVEHVRNTLVDCAAEGARRAALADRTPADGQARTRELVSAALSPAYARDVAAVDTEVGGVPVVEVRVTAPLPVAGLLGPGGRLTVVGHAVRERP